MNRDEFIKKYQAIEKPYSEEELKMICERWFHVNMRGGTCQNEILAIQECSELIKEVTNLLRPDRVNEGVIYDVLQEMADVYNILEYLKNLLGFSDSDILRARSVQIKMDRLEAFEEEASQKTQEKAEEFCHAYIEADIEAIREAVNQNE